MVSRILLQQRDVLVAFTAYMKVHTVFPCILSLEALLHFVLAISHSNFPTSTHIYAKVLISNELVRRSYIGICRQATTPVCCSILAGICFIEACGMCVRRLCIYNMLFDVVVMGEGWVFLLFLLLLYRFHRVALSYMTIVPFISSLWLRVCCILLSECDIINTHKGLTL